jgi:hypothetical protein
VLTGRRRTVDSASRAGFERIGPKARTKGPQKHEGAGHWSAKARAFSGIGPRKHEFLVLPHMPLALIIFAISGRLAERSMHRKDGL